MTLFDAIAGLDQLPDDHCLYGCKIDGRWREESPVFAVPMPEAAPNAVWINPPVK